MSGARAPCCVGAPSAQPEVSVPSRDSSAGTPWARRFPAATLHAPEHVRRSGHTPGWRGREVRAGSSVAATRRRTRRGAGWAPWARRPGLVQDESLRGGSPPTSRSRRRRRRTRGTAGSPRRRVVAWWRRAARRGSDTFSSFQRDPFDGHGSDEVRAVFTAPPGRFGAPDRRDGRDARSPAVWASGSADGMGFRSRTAPFIGGVIGRVPRPCRGVCRRVTRGSSRRVPRRVSAPSHSPPLRSLTNRTWASAAGTGTRRPARAGRGRRVSGGEGTGRSATARVATSFTWASGAMARRGSADLAGARWRRRGGGGGAAARRWRRPWPTCTPRSGP